MASSNDDGDSGWRKQMFFAVTKKRKKGPEVSEQKRCEDIQECLEEGVDINSVDENGDTVLHKAVMGGYLEVVKFLRGQKASIEITNKADLTAFDLAEKLGRTEIFKYLKESSKSAIDQSRPQSLSAPVDIPSNQADISIPVTLNPKRTHDADDDDDGGGKKLRISLNDTSEEQISMDKLDDIEQGYVQGGITKSLHGNIYQLKHYMLILQRAFELGYSFRLAKEMEAADKLDDLVCEYKHKDTADITHRFVQLKHKAAEEEQITASCLLNETGGNFSLLKYFGSWIKINERPEFYESVSKDYIICTNIGLDKEGLKEKGIIVKPLTEPDEFLKVTSSLKGKKPQCYKLQLDANHVLYDVLKAASDIHCLAKVLVEHVHKAEKLTLTTEIFKKYHLSLTSEVVDIGRKQFKENFVDSAKYGHLSRKAKQFHAILLFHAKKLPGNENKLDDDIWRELKNFKFNLSQTFGKGEAEELPDDCISHNGISRFFKELTIAVHQPNEIELTEVLSGEMTEKFKLLNADIPFNYFQTAVLNWFKESGTRGRYLTDINVEKFYAEIRENLSTQVTIGLSLAYKEELRNYGIKFDRENNKLQKFLSSNSASGQLLKLASCQDTLLFALSVYQTLEMMPMYKKDDSYILIKLETLELPNVLENVLLSFRSSRSHSLLIIDCAANSNALYTHPTWFELCEITKKNCNKKLIIIDQIPIDSSTSEKENNCIGFENLDNESRTKLLKKHLTFQGQALSWETLLGIGDLNNIGEEEKEDLARVFDVDTLVKLIRNTPIKIGKEVKELDHDYINRIIIRHGVLKKRILTEPGLTDLIAADKYSSDRLKTSSTLFGETGLLGPGNEECVVLPYYAKAADFDNLCKEHSNRRIHWFEYQSETLICKQFTGGISNLVTYDYLTTSAKHDDNTPIAVWLKDDELIEQDGRVILISDTAGMGKSTLLTKLARRMKEKEPSLLVIRVDLSSPENTSVLLKEKNQKSLNGINKEKAVDFLLDKLVESGSRSHIFKRLIMKVKGRAALFFDGFDEISPGYEETVRTLLCALAELEIKKLVVTTRFHTSERLEQKLETSSYTLRPFYYNDQQNFLIKFWKRELGSTVIDGNTEIQLQDHARNVIKSLANSIDDQLTEFTGIPLQTRMVAEVYSPMTGEKHRKTGNCDFPPIPSSINLITLYREFVGKKYNVYYTDKIHGDKSNLRLTEEQRSSRVMYNAVHQKLALDALFNEHDVISLLRSQTKVQNCFSLWQEGSHNAESTGIVNRVIDGKAEFIHRTYAEYFAAEFLFNMLNAKNPEQDSKIEEDCKKFFLAELFIADRYKIIRAFLNCNFLHEIDVPREEQRRRWNFCRNRDIFDTTPLHRAAEEGNIGIAEFLLNSSESRSKKPVPQNITNGRDQTKVRATTGMKNSDYSDTTQAPKNKESKSSNSELNDIDTRNKKGSTPLHVAILHRNSEMANYLINKGANIDTQDEEGRTPLHFAILHQYYETAKYSIDRGANIDTQDKEGRTPLHEAASHDNSETAKYLIDRGANIDTQDKEGRTPLHEAASHDNSETAKYLIDRGANIDTQDKEGRTPLHEAASHDNSETAKYLIDRGANIDTQDKEGRTPLHEAASYDNSETAKYLSDRGANIHSQDKEGRTPLHHAILHRNSVMANYLINKGANIHTQDEKGRTPLHEAASNYNSETAKYLIDRGANIHTQDEKGRTPLHEAASNYNSETAKYLIDRGANIHTQDEKGRTPLHEAASNDNSETARYLIDRGANIDTQDKEGRTPLHEAASNDNSETAKYLFDRGANIHSRDKEGRTPLHHAILHRNSVMANYLINKGANIHTQDEKGRTPLHEAASNYNSETAKYLFDRGANIHSQDKEGRTPLHEAASNDNSETAKYLFDRGANIHSQDKEGRTPLHKAASNYNSETAKYLIDRGVNIHTQDEKGRTPLHEAASNYNSETAKYLIDRGANIHTQDEKGRTPLHEAVSEYNSETAKYLIDKGANIDTQDKEGRTPLHEAVIALRESNRLPEVFRILIDFSNDQTTAIIKLLLKGGADRTIQDEEGKTPHDLATLTLKSSDKADILFNIHDRNESDSPELEGC